MNGPTGDEAKLRALVERFARAARGEFLRAMRRDLAKQTREEIARAFSERRSPDGTAWEPLKKEGGSPLVESGALRRGFEIDVSEHGIQVGNHVGYAHVHQRGGRIRRRRAQRTARTKRRFGARATVIPARPMVPTTRWGPAPEERLRALSSRVFRKFFVTR